MATLLAEVKESLFHDPLRTPVELAALPVDEVKKVLLDELRDSINEKSAEIGEEVLNRFIQFEYLRNIDSRWQDHLENLESLREAVYLRAYSQKNPLLEYKLEGFQIFDDMLYEIKTTIARKIFRVRIQNAPEKPPAAARPRAALQASHSAVGQFAAGGLGTTAVSPRSPVIGRRKRRGIAAPQAQVKRNVPKVGKNHPAPAGQERNTSTATVSNRGKAAP